MENQADETLSIICDVCGSKFPSKNQLFKHLRVHGFISTKLEKTVLLVGWKSLSNYQNTFVTWDKEHNTNHTLVEQADFGEQELIFAIKDVDYGGKEDDESWKTLFGGVIDQFSRIKGITRASGYSQRASILLSREESSHGVCDVICLSLLPCVSAESWVDKINSRLSPNVRLHGRITLPPGSSDFHCEMACSQRRFEYMVPLSILMPNFKQQHKHEESSNQGNKEENILPHERHLWCPMDRFFPRNSDEGLARVEFFRNLKNVLKLFAGKHSYHCFEAAGASPDDSVVKRRVDRFYHMELWSRDLRRSADPPSASDSVVRESNTASSSEDDVSVVFSISGDAFLRGQVRHMVGLVIAVSQGWLPEEFVSSALCDDEVVSIRSAPAAAVYLAECKFDKWESKHSLRLGPVWDHVESPMGAFSDPKHILLSSSDPVQRTAARAWLWREEVRQHVYEVLRGQSSSGWSEWKASTQLRCAEIMREWSVLRSLRQRALVPSPAIQPAIEIISQELAVQNRQGERQGVAAAYEEVLRLLIEADLSGSWPVTSLGRQKVIQRTDVQDTNALGGSFSVGVLPPPNVEPRGNSLFPDLVRACFRLERALCPDRPPSSTIAINRHAQFRPHRDSGAGSGQSVSLIVALGDFFGGELVVEGVAKDIRYRALEFDGWGLRHWTLPFVGQRYSLVWFTPLGAESLEKWWL